jgi:hypothetical protein
VFYLAYHLHWSYPDIMGLPTDERWAYVRLLAAQQEREREEVERARRD